MFDWLFEGRFPVYLLLATVTAVLLAMWWRTRKQKLLIGAGAVVLLAGVYFLLSVAKETDRRQIERKLQEMAEGVNANNLDRSFAHVSESFRRGSATRQTFRQWADGAIRSYQVRNMRIWDTDVAEVSRENRSARVNFSVRAETNGGETPPFLCRAQFVLDPDGQWRLQTFDLFNPVVDQERPIDLRF